MTSPRVSTAGQDAGERRIAARHLLSSPILTASRQPAELDLVRHHAAALKSMFASQLGYALIVESTFARLVKAPLTASAPVRPARRAAGDSPFTATSYVHLALACAALLAPGIGEQILISSLVDQIRADAAEQSITVTDGISDRRQLVTALKLLASWGVVTETDGTLTGWGERPEDEALLSINRPLLIHLLPSPLHHFGTAEETWSQRQPEPPRRRLRQRLVENPAVFRAELPDDELDVLSRERHELARHLDENFGLVLEVRAEGALAYDPSGAAGGLTDLDFPGTGSARQAVLLLPHQPRRRRPGAAADPARRRVRQGRRRHRRRTDGPAGLPRSGLRDDGSRAVGLLPAGAAAGRVRSAAQRRQLGPHHPRALGRPQPPSAQHGAACSGSASA